MTERLQKVLARAGIASRRAAEKLILAGRVTVNDAIVSRLGTRVDAARDSIRVDGKRIARAAPIHVYLMLNKPRGYVTTLKDPEGRPSIRDLIRDIGARVYPVGRLDFASEGLLLLTNDGDLANALMHPSRGVSKTYLVKVQGRPEDEARRRLASGITLDGRRTLPAQIEILRLGSNSWLEVTIREGRKHQIRRMLEAVGHRVTRLRRIRYGGLALGKLPVARYRYLGAEEVAHLRRVTGGRDGGALPRKRAPRRA